MLRRCAPLVAALLFGTVSPGAMAQGKDPAAADALFRAGREAMKNKDYATACPKFAESQRLDPAPGTLLNLAQCEEGLGKTASAVQHYRDVTELLPATDQRAGHANERIAALLPRVPKLTITLARGAPEGTRVTRSGVELGAASFGEPLPVDPGQHEIVVSASGRKTTRTTLTIKSGENRTVTASVGEPVAESAETEPEPKREASTPAARGDVGSAPAAKSGAGSTVRTLGYVAGAIGIVGLGTGAYFAFKAKDQDAEANKLDDENGDCLPDTACLDWDKKYRDSVRMSSIGFIGGGALLATGLIMIIAAPSSSPAQSPGKVAVGIGGPGTWLGANVTGRW